MTTSIRTPELVLASGALTTLLQDANNGEADIQQGKLVIGASNGMCRVVKTDLDRRLAAPKLEAIERKSSAANEDTRPSNRRAA